MSQPTRLPNSVNLSFVEGLYADYLREPSSVPAEWRRYFEMMEDGAPKNGKPRLGPSFRPPGLFNPLAQAGALVSARLEAGAAPLEEAWMQERVDQLIRAYRFRGHMIARINPLGFPRSYPPEL